MAIDNQWLGVIDWSRCQAAEIEAYVSQEIKMSHAGIVTIQGDFTLLKYIATLNSKELERTIGFDSGRLNSGFSIVALCGDETLRPEDFDLRASTRWSGGQIQKAENGDEKGIEHLLLGRGADIGALKAKIAAFFAKRGGNTPAKVLPNLRHTKGMFYPDAEALGPGIRSGVPQFSLVTPRRFLIVRDERH